MTLYSSAKDGIRTNDAFVMDGGDVRIETASGAGKGIKVEGKEDDTAPLGFIAINDGTLNVTTTDDALNAGTSIVINGGHVYARSSVNDAVDSTAP